MVTLCRVSLFVLLCSSAALHGYAQCAGQPQIPNLTIDHSVGGYMLAWDAPAGVSSPVYEIMQTTQAEYCPFESNPGAYSAVGTTTARTFTGSKSSPNAAYLIFVRVQGNPCIRSSNTSAADSFTSPPAKPVFATAKFAGGEVGVGFFYNDTRAVSIWLYRVADQKFIAAASPCSANPKVIRDQAPIPSAYRLIAFNTGNAAGLAGVASESFTPSTESAPPGISFTASPRTIRAGESARLLWRTNNASSVSISELGSQGRIGSAVVSPAETTTYVLTATNGSGTSTAEAVVEVLTEPEITLAGLPEPMVQGTGAGGATTSYVLGNAGGASTTISLSQQGDFFSQSPTTFTLAPGERQRVTITSIQRETGSYRGFSLVSGDGVPEGASVPIRLLSVPTPTGRTSARPARSRVDVSAPQGTNPAGSVSFVNTGEATIQAALVSTAPWLIPDAQLIEVDPGESVEATFAIDRSRRPANARLGSLEAKMKLVFRKAPAGKRGSVEPHNGTATTTSLVTVVDTSKPPVAPGELPPLGADEVALFIPGAGHLQGGAGLFFSDIALVNLSASRTLNDIDLYYTPTTGSSQTMTTTVSGLAAGTPLVLADVVETVFDSESTLGSLQIRGASLDQLSVNANILLQTRGEDQQYYGNTIPALRSDHSSGPGESAFVTGLTSSETSHTNLFIQEMGGGNVTVDLEFFDEAGLELGEKSGVEVGPFRLTGLFHSDASPTVPLGAVSAVITSRPESTGRFGAYATPVDRRSGDSWSLVDWNAQSGFLGGEEMVIPVAGALRGQGGLYFRTDLAIVNRGAEAASGILRYIPRPGEARAPIDRTITLGAGQSTVLEDVTTTLFEIDPDVGTVGFLKFTPSSGSMTVTSRNFATEGEDPGTFGTGVPTLPLTASLKLGDVARIGGVKDASIETNSAGVPGTMRSNFAMMETSGADTVTIRVTVYYTLNTGSAAVARGSGSKEYTLQPNEYRQLNRVSREVLGESRDDFGDFDNLQVEFAVIDGDGSAAVFVSSVDNGSGDSTLRVD